MKFGCNYWASNAGTEMWRMWDENVIREDMRLLHEAGNQVLRIFPLWRDFQPIELARQFHSKPQEVVINNLPLPQTFCGQNGVDEVMLDRLRFLIHEADSYGMQIILPLITGWMSGMLYVPPAIVNLDIFTDPFALKWQAKYIRTLVHELKNEKAILMWELGNECNAMRPVASGDVAYNWTNMVASVVRAEDNTRPVSSGMHGLGGGNVFAYEPDDNWTIQTQGEICDYLTPHPYPHSCSKPPAQLDPHTSFRGVNVAAAENQLFADLSNRPAFIEEINTFSSGYCDEHTKALCLRNNMYNAWAHGSEYFLWWCAFEQKKLAFPPYDWGVWERELGEYQEDGTLREAVRDCKAFAEFQKTLPFEKLSPCRRDAVCLVSREMGYQHFLTNTWTTFAMSKLCGFNIKFHYLNYQIPESDLYLVPGVRSLMAIYYREMNELLERVRNGATLYMSVDENGLPSNVQEIFGCDFVTREKRTSPVEFTYKGQRFSVPAPRKMVIKPLDCDVLAAEDDGNPVYLHRAYGKGHIYLLTVPLEDHLGQTPHVFDKDAPDVCSIYREFCGDAVARRIARSFDRYVTLTEHTDENGRHWIVAVNNNDEAVPAEFDLSAGWQILSALPEKMEGHSCIVFEVSAR